MNAQAEAVQAMIEEPTVQTLEERIAARRRERTQLRTVPKYPHVTVHIVTRDGQSMAFVVAARVAAALRHAGASAEEIDEFLVEAMAGDTRHLLCTCLEWCQVD